ncbi:MAG TPA: biotin--[acetyl-CoA-carboxylase] ligase, partial [Chitinophagaceae bacterium]|nr:biotin--[acetyl-CoA-carboxylase] ligase [Chitinophagaceae bacterium]
SSKPQIWKWAVVGIGININQTIFPDDLPNPVSLKQITGKSFEPVEIAKEICSVLEKNYQILIGGKFEHLFSYYQTHLYKKDEKVKLKKGNRVFETTINGVSETGQLITQHSIEERFEFGEVEWML